MSEQLKPCPFCGSTGITINGIVNSHRFMQCNRCLAHGPADPHALEALENLWNNRPIENALHGRIDEMDDVMANMGHDFDVLKAENERLRKVMSKCLDDFDPTAPELMYQALKQALEQS